MKFAAALLAATLASVALAGAASAAPPLKAADYAKILANKDRPDADRNDDAARMPAEVLDFMKIRPGDSILELEGGRGWYSEILSQAVGPEGFLIVQFPPEFAYGHDAYQKRKDAGRLKNATITVSHFDALQAPDNSVDKVIWVLGPHELYYTPKDSKGLGDVDKSYAEIKRVLKPGGMFIAMDHAADKGAATTTGQTIHRIDPAVVLASAKKAGLVYVGKSEVLANPKDDRTKPVFDATLRRHTDQFLFSFQKPAKKK